ncbi:MAG: hypothetical protein RDU20_14890 [Desulfomonilaceae bacterium]|nr:hypothetical protein [Desulfomonilaceae bacterium]
MRRFVLLNADLRRDRRDSRNTVRGGLAMHGSPISMMTDKALQDIFAA